MAFVPGYEHDIFVSYAHVDDQRLPGADEGWVTTLVNGLRTLLAQKLGRREAYSLWMDHQLAGHVPITPAILDTLRNTAAILIILSPGYLASEWCLREKNSFLNTVKERARSSSRVFIVERDKIEARERPPEFQELRGYHFWVQDREDRPPRILGEPRPSDPRYYDVLNDLVHELTRELQSLKAAAGYVPVAMPAPTAATTVFLAEVTDDLEPRRDEVKRYLDQANVRVLPDTWYSPDPATFQQAVDRDLGECTLFVQLLSDVVGKRPPGVPQGYAHLQYERAVAARKPILQWRSPTLNMDAVVDAGHRTFLDLDTILAVGIEEFKREVVQHTLAKPPAPRPRRDAALVFVNAQESDRSLAESIGRALRQHDVDVGVVFPLRSGIPVEVREDLEENLKVCDGLIIVYGNITVKWVRDQLRQWRKVGWQRERPLQAGAVYLGPPEPKDPLDFELPALHHIDGRKGLIDSELQQFLISLKGKENL